jgi:hypothetical protein
MGWKLMGRRIDGEEGCGVEMCIQLSDWWIAAVGDCMRACLAMAFSRLLSWFLSSITDCNAVCKTFQTAAVNVAQSVWDMPIMFHGALGKLSRITETRKPCMLPSAMDSLLMRSTHAMYAYTLAPPISSLSSIFSSSSV